MILSSLQIDCICTNHYHTSPFYKGVFSIDNVPNKVHSFPAFYICDAVTRLHHPNIIGHWVLIIFPKRDTPAEFFDPMGKPPAFYGDQLTQFLMANSSQSSYKFNPVQVQSQQSDSCGAFCLYVADQRIIGLTLAQSVSSLHMDRLSANDQIVQNYVIRHMIRPEPPSMNPNSRRNLKKKLKKIGQ